mmetsp:Transcript_12457/g.37389  ORF Transcript_12457/g.37389 Transcript_12457/m.37389 type:complete len:686 (-) Transcript_12457:1189-3246(-)
MDKSRSGRPAKRAKTEVEVATDTAIAAEAAGPALPAAAGPAVDAPCLEQPWVWASAADWLRTHNGGQWAVYASKFDGLLGRQLCDMTEEQMKTIVDSIAHGITIFNDIAKLKKPATSSSSESSPGSASGPSEHASLWAALRGAERKQSTAVTLGKLEADPTRFVEQQTGLGDTIAELEVKIANAGVAAGDLGDEAGAAAAAPAQEAADDAVVVVTLPKGCTWMTEDAEHMFVRPCWRKLFGILSELRASKTSFIKGQRRGVIVTGNPGIGKSWFLNYVLYRVARDEPSSSVVFESVGDGLLWVFSPDGSVRRHHWEDRRDITELENVNNLYLFDPAGLTGVSREPQPCKAFTVVTSSPDKTHYNEFHKHGAKKRYMDLWSLAQLRVCASFVGISPSATEKRFLRHGGVARSVITADSSEVDKALDSALTTVDFDAVVRSVGLDDAVKAATHKIVAYTVLDKDACATVRVDFASAYIARAFFSRYYKAKRSDLLTFLKSAEGTSAVSGVCGTLFEHLVHRTLVNGGTFKLRRLDGGAGPAHVRVVPLDTTTVRRVSGLSAIRAVADKPMYVQPEFGNFPVLDGLMLNATDGASLSRFVGVQSTVSLHHPLKQAPLLSIIQGLDKAESDGLDVIFVVWPSTFERFKMQQYLTADGKVSQRVSALIQKAVRQWVLEVPLTEPAGSPPK